MKLIDASSIMKAWDDYPCDQFPKLWEWILREFASENLRMIKPNFQEVEKVSPDCASFIKPSCNQIPITDAELHVLARLEAGLGIDDEVGYHNNGVDQSDLLLISAAITYKCTIISDEAPQLALPKITRKYKIPAVCRMNNVICFDFRSFIKSSNQVF